MNWFNERGIEEIGIFEVLEAYRAGQLKLPLYQRDAVWSEGRICALWDSLLRGFPLPAFLLARGEGSSRVFATNGWGEVADTGSQPYFDVLDGQQRISAIIAGTGRDSSIRLWVDLAPQNQQHPLRFTYWLHPCTNIFPFGVHMQAGGEHDFQAMNDRTLQALWQSIQNTPLSGKDYYELPLTHTFPWEAGCPVPLADLLGLVESAGEPGTLENQIQALAQHHKQAMGIFQKEPDPPNPAMVGILAKGLARIRRAKLVLQYIDLGHIEQDGEHQSGYELFERIGRGGVQITPRQLAVSKLMLTLGKPGNDALASFQKTEYGRMLETEDVVHALARCALAEAKSTGTTDSETGTGEDLELLDLNPERLHKIKLGKPDIWEAFQNILQSYCDPAGDDQQSQLGLAFHRVFTLVKFHPETNPNGFPLLQLAQATGSQEGIAPITLHPLLLWQFKHSHGQTPDRQQQDEMLRWLLFANGIGGDRRNTTLNRVMFNQVNQSGLFVFSDILDGVFGSEGKELRQQLGFHWTDHRLTETGEIEDIQQEYSCLPTPLQIATLSAKRLLLRNWVPSVHSVHSGVGDFVLMWNQRQGLHEMYGHTQPEHFPALFGKGRPFDADHIVPRSRFLYFENREEILRIREEIFRNGCATFFKDPSHTDKHFMRDWCFRKHLPNMGANYRYWPKRLNRADNNDTVPGKMPVQTILSRLGGHPLSRCFSQVDGDTPWIWSAIPMADREAWEKLPPADNQWTPELVEAFIGCLLRREYFLYGNAYRFLTGNPIDGFDHRGII